MSAITLAEAPAAPAPSHRLIVAIIIVAALEAIGAAWDVPSMLYDYDHGTTLLNVAQVMTKAKIGLAFIVASAALWFSATARPRLAVGLLGALATLRWTLEVPTSWMIHGVELDGGLLGVVVFAQQFVYPLIGVAALALAWRNEHLNVATVLVALPPLASITMIAAFAFAVMIYGF
jgi:hypothetical protein